MKNEVNGKSVFNWMIIGCLSGVLGTGCVAQQADLAKVQKDLDKQIREIRVEKKALDEEMRIARAEIDESRNEIAAQKSNMSNMRSDLAPMNQRIKLIMEEDLTNVYGKFEMTEKSISDLRKDVTGQGGKLNADIQTLQTTIQAQDEQQQATQTQVTALVQQVDEKNQVLTQKMTEFQAALGQFKETLGSLGTDVSQMW